MDEKHLKILIVDDEEALRESTSSILDLYGYETKTASCGTEAIEMVKTFLSTPFEGGRHQRRIDKIRVK